LVSNLVDGAIQHNRPGGRVEAITRRGDRTAVVACATAAAGSITGQLRGARSLDTLSRPMWAKTADLLAYPR
jgi:hypothetical protein